MEKAGLVKLTQSAVDHMTKLIDEQGKPIVRLSVKGGGCAGFGYEWAMTEELEEKDEIIDLPNGQFAIDQFSIMYVAGTEIDFIKEVFGSQLVIKNPNATSSCGCGESFSA
jgi:iron-sulfur cluster assembly accessory protein|tara:strand:- start:4184 stop:4516 length:333 start_codon:yes stop_codon:yes gene_type:complete